MTRRLFHWFRLNIFHFFYCWLGSPSFISDRLALEMEIEMEIEIEMGMETPPNHRLDHLEWSPQWPRLRFRRPHPIAIQQKSSKNPAGIQQESSRNISIWKISSAHRHIHFNKSANERRWAHKSINRQLAIDLPVSALTLQRCHHVSRRSARLRCDLAEVRCEPVTQSVFRYANYAGRNSRCDCELRPCLFLSFFLFHSPVLRISWPGSIQSSLNASHLIHSGMMFSWELNGAMEKFCRALLPNINNIRHWNGWEMVRNFQWRQSPIKRKSNFTSSNDE